MVNLIDKSKVNKFESLKKKALLVYLTVLFILVSLMITLFLISNKSNNNMLLNINLIITFITSVISVFFLTFLYPNIRNRYYFFLTLNKKEETIVEEIFDSYITEPVIKEGMILTRIVCRQDYRNEVVKKEYYVSEEVKINIGKRIRINHINLVVISYEVLD